MSGAWLGRNTVTGDGPAAAWTMSAVANRRLRKRRPGEATQRVGRSVHAGLGKTPRQDGLAALRLLVQGAPAEPIGDALAPTALMRAASGVQVVAPRYAMVS